jgi:glycosyltransferase involved in cell wall biosynthesis
MLEPRKILYVNTLTSFYGGAEISLLLLMKNLDPLRYRPYLLTSGPGGLIDEAHQAGIPTATQDFPWLSRRRPWPYLSSIISIARLASKNKIDLIHTNCDHSLRYVRYASLLSGTPYVSHVRDAVRTWFQPTNLAALKHARAVLTNSQAMRQVCQGAGIQPEKIHVIYNGIDLDTYRQVTPQTRHRLRANMKIPENAVVVGFVGQTQQIKGLGEFIEAALSLAATNPEVYFLVVGRASNPQDQSFFDDCKRSVEDSSVSKRFYFLGFRQDIPEIMKTIDILIVPSHSESFGRVAAEGMASGCAVIASDTGGLPEIITDNYDGLLIPPQNSSALCEVMLHLTSDFELRSRLSTNAAVSVSRFSIKNHVQSVEMLYDKVLSNPSKQNQ